MSTCCWDRETSNPGPGSRRNVSRPDGRWLASALGEKPLSTPRDDAALFNSTGGWGVIPPRFEYFAPSSVDEAVQILDRFGGDAKVLAGGQSLLPVMKLRLAEPRALVDINRIPDLAHIREDAKSLRIGATTRTNDLNDSEVIHARYPILSDAAYEIANPLASHSRRWDQPRERRRKRSGIWSVRRRMMPPSRGPRNWRRKSRALCRTYGVPPSTNVRWSAS